MWVSSTQQQAGPASILEQRLYITDPRGHSPHNLIDMELFRARKMGDGVLRAPVLLRAERQPRDDQEFGWSLESDVQAKSSGSTTVKA